MPLRDIGTRLGPAIAAACGTTNDVPFRLAADKRHELKRSALAHRDLLWQAMAAPRQAVPASPTFLTEWLAHEPQATRQRVESVLDRLRPREMAARR
jgi:hypothetical protein